MLLYPNCKINLGLRVLNKRPDGYHNIETIFVPIYGLHDDLEVTVSNSFSFEQQGITVDCSPEDNLICRCYHLFANEFPQIQPVKILFHKRIPFGAGLGGGSSDAAHMAIALNELFHLGLTKEMLAARVKSLGADCPFFIYNQPCLATGIGDVLTPVNLDLSGLRIILIKPEDSVSTREAYGNLQISDTPIVPLPTDHLDFSKYINDFEASVFPLHPSIAHIKKRLLNAGALFASMSGSGSTVYGLFKNDTESCTLTQLRKLEQEFASMILFNNTLC